MSLQVFEQAWRRVVRYPIMLVVMAVIPVQVAAIIVIKVHTLRPAMLLLVPAIVIIVMVIYPVVFQTTVMIVLMLVLLMV